MKKVIIGLIVCLFLFVSIREVILYIKKETLWDNLEHNNYIENRLVLYFYEKDNTKYVNISHLGSGLPCLRSEDYEIEIDNDMNIIIDSIWLQNGDSAVNELGYNDEVIYWDNYGEFELDNYEYYTEYGWYHEPGEGVYIELHEVCELYESTLD